MAQKIALLVSNISKDDCELYKFNDVLVGDTTVLKIEIEKDCIVSAILGIEKIDKSGRHYWDNKELEVLDESVQQFSHQ